MSSNDSSIPIEEQSRRCSKCKEFKAADAFGIDRTHPTGRNRWCKLCHSEYHFRRKYGVDLKEHLAIEAEYIQKQIKMCPKCGEVKPYGEFSPSKINKKGVASWCKTCVTIATRKRRENPDVRERERKYQRERARYDPEYRRQVREYAKRPEVRAKRKIYKQNLKPESKAKAREYARWYDQTEQGKIARRTGRLRYRARKRNAGGWVGSEDIAKMYKNHKGKCHWCGVKLPENYHVDHVQPLSKGGTNDPSNLVLSCPSCNSKKHNKLPHELGWRLF